MCRCIVARVVNVNESPVDDRYRFEEVGQDFAKVMTVFEGHVCRQNNVDLDDQLVASMIGSEVLDLTDSCGEAHGKVEE